MKKLIYECMSCGHVIDGEQMKFYLDEFWGDISKIRCSCTKGKSDKTVRRQQWKKKWIGEE